MRGFLERLWAHRAGHVGASSSPPVAKPYPSLTIRRCSARREGRAAAARVVALGAAPVRRPRAGQRAAADRAGDRRALRLRRGAAGAARGPCPPTTCLSTLLAAARGRGPAVPPRVRQPGAERAGRRHRHHPEPARARACGCSPGTRTSGRCWPRARSWSAAAVERGAAVRADHAVHRPDLRWTRSSTAASCSRPGRSWRSARSGPTATRRRRTARSFDITARARRPAADLRRRAPTTAWAPTWPGPSSRRRWRSSCRACPGSPRTARRNWAAWRGSTGSSHLPLRWSAG